MVIPNETANNLKLFLVIAAWQKAFVRFF